MVVYMRLALGMVELLVVHKAQTGASESVVVDMVRASGNYGWSCGRIVLCRCFQAYIQVFLETFVESWMVQTSSVPLEQQKPSALEELGSWSAAESGCKDLDMAIGWSPFGCRSSVGAVIEDPCCTRS